MSCIATKTTQMVISAALNTQTEKSKQNSENCTFDSQSNFHGSVNFKRVSCQKHQVSKCSCLVHQVCNSNIITNLYQSYANKC